MSQQLVVCLLSVLAHASLICCSSSKTNIPYICSPANLKKAPYPEWAHYHWVWLSNDRANQSSMMQYAKEYLDHNISVGAVDIDSGWSTGFNNFIFDTHKYPNASEMVDFFHVHKIRVILWATSMIDTDSSNYKEAHDKEYFLRNFLGEQATISWWHGKGGLLDYTNPDALNWWHKQMDNVLSLGIDGWKCDGTDPYVYELISAKGKGGSVSRKDYSDSYYGDFFDYTRKKLGEDRLIMSRPVDGFSFIFLDFSPRRVLLSGWVGDDDPTFEGMESALKSYLQSAWAGYPNFGSDIGGYRTGDGDLGRTKDLLIRWAQLGAFSPLMENGGNKEHRPWIFGNEAMDIYKRFVDIHYQLVPYLLSVGSTALENGRSSITPLAKHNGFIEKLVDDFNPSTYNYLLGDQILVAPIYQNQQKTVSIDFPAGSNNSSSWVYWFNHTVVYHSKSSVANFSVPLEEFSVFAIAGQILPLRITKDTHFLGTYPFLIGSIKWWLFLSDDSQMHHHSFQLREENGSGMIATWRWLDLKLNCIQFNLTAHTSIHSFVEIETLKFKKISLLQEVVSANVPNEYRTITIYDNLSEIIVANGGAVIMRNNDLLSLSIHFIGDKKYGHSVNCCFE